ncbi:MAG: site-specific DNA-methyltransferase [Chloroflexi bacterium]|nr:site-specific DNA-methyltransferase [Chloroflexota bacterium]
MAVINLSTEHREALLRKFEKRIEVNRDLDRGLVSYQEDKETPFYRWFKYKEGFTSRLVSYLLNKVHPVLGLLLDPFAGSGAALFAAASAGWETSGIDVLPVGIHIVQARISANLVDINLFIEMAEKLKSLDFSAFFEESNNFKHIPITKGAFPPENEKELIGYISYCKKYIQNEHVQRLALFASFCILEDISYTRKDGQYLRWDVRSGRSLGKEPFNKGEILSFPRAIEAKLNQMMHDLQFGRLFETNGVSEAPAPRIVAGSCLEILPTLESASINVILTSPPYCNRYDYTRTYALELVYLGACYEEVTKLRQTMLTCTVENKTKREDLKAMYEKLGQKAEFDQVEEVFQSLAALQEVLSILDAYKDARELNNPQIARMVRNYFYEMCFVIFEMARILTPGGHVIMVNDNVRYAGEEVPVDLILSSMAETFGLTAKKIWTLGRGKGNSSQQMGSHGRTELRKCVYVWEKEQA